MEVNGPLGILTGLAVIGLIVGGVVYDSVLTFQQAFDLALRNWVITAPVGGLLLLVVLFGDGGGAGGVAP